MKSSLIKIVILAFSLAALAGCASSGGLSGSETATDGTAYDGGTGTYPYPGGGTGASGQYVGGPTATAAQRVVYFDYDSAEIRADSRGIVEAHANYLVNDPASAVVLEGHTDERGTREYNIGLGERRAESVRRTMLAYGVAPQQIRVVSYGEERPAMGGADEGAYAQNRRVEIVY